ncbi:MAG: hypothetical protein CFE34_05655 [Rhodobacteraceae bacterium PARR1]|nr:MAG: hypothetical protein CFE34_05655 [Rhodobacteraceae bacterium PARR1]
MKMGRKMQVWRCVALGLALAGGPAWAGMAGAQALPPHAVDYDAAAGRCRIVLTPAGTTGDAPPRLFLTSDLMKPGFGFGLDGKDIAEAVVIRDGTRTPFLSRQGLDGAALQADPFWSGLVAKEEGKDSLYLTIKDAKGSYSSARYDGLHATDVWRLAALACDATGLDVTPQTPVEFRAAEAALALSDADRLRLRQVLAAKYGEPGTEVGTDPALTVTDRRFIAQYNTEKGQPSGDYLTAAAVKDLLATALPTAAPAPVGGEGVVASFGDWVQLRSADGATCRIATTATDVAGADPATRMEFAVGRGDKGGRMAIDLAKPNPFNGGAAIVAKVDDNAFNLTVEPASAALIPQPLANGSMSNAMMVAIRRGAQVVIQGSAADGAPMGVAFSAKGFSAAFAAMAKDCNRPGVMGWIE